MEANKGYHYIRYAVWGIYLAFFVTSYELVSAHAADAGAWLIPTFGIVVTILAFVMDKRNQFLWHKTEAREIPGRASVTFFLWPFYLLCFIWYVFVLGSFLFTNQDPPEAEEIEIVRQRVRLDAYMASLGARESAVSDAEQQLQTEQTAFESERLTQEELLEKGAKVRAARAQLAREVAALKADREALQQENPSQEELREEKAWLQELRDLVATQWVALNAASEAFQHEKLSQEELLEKEAMVQELLDQGAAESMALKTAKEAFEKEVLRQAELKEWEEVLKKREDDLTELREGLVEKPFLPEPLRTAAAMALIPLCAIILFISDDSDSDYSWPIGFAAIVLIVVVIIVLLWL